jgi:hypothetical protein
MGAERGLRTSTHHALPVTITQNQFTERWRVAWIMGEQTPGFEALGAGFFHPATSNLSYQTLSPHSTNNL